MGDAPRKRIIIIIALHPFFAGRVIKAMISAVAAPSENAHFGSPLWPNGSSMQHGLAASPLAAYRASSYQAVETSCGPAHRGKCRMAGVAEMLTRASLLSAQWREASRWYGSGASAPSSSTPIMRALLLLLARIELNRINRAFGAASASRRNRIREIRGEGCACVKAASGE